MGHEKLYNQTISSFLAAFQFSTYKFSKYFNLFSDTSPQCKTISGYAPFIGNVKEYERAVKYNCLHDKLGTYHE